MFGFKSSSLIFVHVLRMNGKNSFILHKKNAEKYDTLHINKVNYWPVI